MPTDESRKDFSLNVYTFKAYSLFCSNPGNDGMCLRRLSDGTVIFEMYSENDMPDKIRHRIAARLKKVSRRFATKSAKNEYLCLADAVIGKSKECLIGLYGELMFKDIVNAPLDPITAAAVEMIDKQMNAVAYKYSKMVADYTNSMYKERDNILKELSEKKGKLIGLK